LHYTYVLDHVLDKAGTYSRYTKVSWPASTAVHMFDFNLQYNYEICESIVVTIFPYDLRQ